MRVISKARLRQFWDSSNYGDAEGPLCAWFTHVSNKSIAWQNWSDVRSSFRNADLVGNCVVFNIGGNKYRLITRILYPSQKVFVLRVMKHAVYDQDKWKQECGCFQGPPKAVAKRVVKKVRVAKKSIKGKKDGK